jgi:hypothetical protein
VIDAAQMHAAARLHPRMNLRPDAPQQHADRCCAAQMTALSAGRILADPRKRPQIAGQA